MGRGLIVSVGIAFAIAAPVTQASRQLSARPLEVSLACANGPELSFRLTVENVSTGPAAAVIGAILSNDAKYVLGPATLIVSRPGEPNVTLTYIDTSIPGIAGRVDPWLVMLPARASYSVSVPARNFRSRPDLASGDFTRTAKVQLQLTTQNIADTNLDMKGQKLIHVWVGTLVSQSLEVPDHCAP